MTSTPSSPVATRPKSFPLAWFIRAAVSVAVLTLLFTIVPIADVWNEAMRLPPLLWISGLALFLAGHAAAAAKWRLLIGAGVSFPQAFQAHLAGLAANLCLPGLAGGDVVRAGLVARSAEDGAQLAMGSIADRLVDIFGLLVIAIVGAFLSLRRAQGEYDVLWWLLVASMVALAVLAPASLGLDRALKKSRREGRIGRLFVRAVSVTAHLARQPGRLLLCLAISMAVQATFVGINIAFARAVQLEAPVAAWFFAWSTAKIVAIAPISMGGLGVREATMAKLLANFGADPARVIAIGLIWQTVLYASGLIGALAQMVWMPHSEKVAAPDPAGAAVERSP
ncbi:MAG: lysylphosphatidylglycerol synthase transmembrane domain-containing protein [Betaproteobacteria bacterium]